MKIVISPFAFLFVSTLQVLSSLPACFGNGDPQYFLPTDYLNRLLPNLNKPPDQPPGLFTTPPMHPGATAHNWLARVKSANSIHYQRQHVQTHTHQIFLLKFFCKGGGPPVDLPVHKKKDDFTKIISAIEYFEYETPNITGDNTEFKGM